MWVSTHHVSLWRQPVSATRAGRRIASFALLWAGSIQLAVHAEPLPSERCDQLAAELSLLEGGGAGENIRRGPEWAKTHLTPEQVKYIERLIAVREDLNFRCRTFAVVREPPPPAPPATEQSPAAVTSQPPLPARPAAAADPKRKPTQNSADKGAGAAPGAVPARKPEPATEQKPATERAPKRKANDAYVPPPGTESTFTTPLAAGQ